MPLLDRHIGFLEALRAAGLPVSLAEGLDAVRAVGSIGWDQRETVRTAYAATLVKRAPQRPTFDAIFDLYFPPLVGDGVAGQERAGEDPVRRDNAEALTRFREHLLEAMAGETDPDLAELAAEAVGRFGSLPGRGQGLSSWSAYQALNRVAPDDLTARLVAALQQGGLSENDAHRAAGRRIGGFARRVEADARRRIAEEKGPAHMADVAVRPAIDRLDFTSARRDEVAAMRREIQPLARRLATRLTREQHARRRGPVDFRRTVRASIATGGVPLQVHHRPQRPHRNDLVVLCDVSGSVASFAQFTLLLVFTLREMFTKVRAFTFVDHVVEVTSSFRPGADPADVLADLAASTRQAALWGRTNYGRAFTTFVDQHADALGPRTSLLVLGDARSNHSDLALPVVQGMVDEVRHAWWLNPEHPRHWGTGDSAAHRYGALVPMVECRNLVQLGEFVHDLV